MNIQYHMKLNNEYDFKCYCAKQSIAAFQKTIEQKQYPSRYRLFVVLLKDIIYTPGYLVGKISDIFIHIWNLYAIEETEPKPLHFRDVVDMGRLIAIQLMIPVVCTTIRICATIAGFLVPHLAVRGWEIAENGEALSYQLWSQSLQSKMGVPNFQDNDVDDELQDIEEQDIEAQSNQAHAEINPSNAIFYLGVEQTRSMLSPDIEKFGELEEEIIASLTEMLQVIALGNPDCFHKLVYYDYAIAPDQRLSNKCREYLLSHDVKQILFQLKLGFPTDNSVKQNEIDQWMIEQITRSLTLEQMHRLFVHINFNMENVLIADEEFKLEQDSIEESLSLLQDLFSQRLRFGRAQFPQPPNGCFIYPQV